MKKSITTVTAFCLVIFFLNAGCQKELVCDSCAGDNKAPFAAAGPDQVITLPMNAAILNGQGSSDPDGSIRRWRWNKIAGPQGATIEQPDSSLTRVIQLSAGTYQYELTVTDDQGLAARDTVHITVLLTANRPPLANAGPDQVLILPTNSTVLNGGGSSDPDNNLTSYLWTRVSGPQGFNIQQPASVQTMVSQLSVGVHVFQLTVTDAGGLTDRDSILVTVSPANLPPVAHAGADQVITLPVNRAFLKARFSTDPENNSLGYLWRQIAGTGQANILYPSAEYCLVDNLAQGTYEFELTVTDPGGLFSKDSVKVMVVGAPTASPAVFDNLFWVDSGYCYIAIPNIYSFIPAGAALTLELKVFDFFGQPSAWLPVRIQGSQLQGDYANYTIENGDLKVHALMVNCHFDDALSYSIRITY